MREKFNALLTESEESGRKNRVEQENKHKEDVATLTSSRIELEETHIRNRREFEGEVSLSIILYRLFALLKRCSSFLSFLFFF